MNPAPPLRSPRRAARLWQKLLLLLGAVVVNVGVAELSCRLSGAFPPDPLTWPGQFENKPRQAFLADPDLGWRMRPGVTFTWKTEGESFGFVADAAGFRADDRPERPAVPADAARIDFVGDSFTFGTGVTAGATFVARSGELLRADARNRGMPGFGVDQMMLTTERVVLPEKPALVVLSLITDDFQRSLHCFRSVEGFNKPAFKLVDGALVPKTAADRPGGLAGFVDRQSHFAAALHGLGRRLGRRYGVGEWWAINRACLERTAAACRAAGVPLLIVHLPQREGFQPFPALARFCRDRDLPFLDIAVVWTTPPAGAYWPKDGHFNAHGHELVAAALVQEIRTRWPQLAR